MGRPTTFLEKLCGHSLALGKQSIEVSQGEDGYIWAFAGEIRVGHYLHCSREGIELLESLRAALKKPVRTVLAGKLHFLYVRASGNSADPPFSVSIKSAPRPDPSFPPPFTEKQG
jgi:hypothetical protein